jgi:hypothetical protein
MHNASQRRSHVSRPRAERAGERLSGLSPRASSGVSWPLPAKKTCHGADQAFDAGRVRRAAAATISGGRFGAVRISGSGGCRRARSRATAALGALSRTALSGSSPAHSQGCTGTEHMEIDGRPSKLCASGHRSHRPQGSTCDGGRTARKVTRRPRVYAGAARIHCPGAMGEACSHAEQRCDHQSACELPSPARSRGWSSVVRATRKGRGK